MESESMDKNTKKAFEYYLKQSEQYWINKGIYQQGMICLSLHRQQIPEYQAIVKSLKERALQHDELGRYWKYPVSWWWYQAPIETRETGRWMREIT